MNCRHCGARADLPFLDLGSSPPSNAFLIDTRLRAPETWFPLRLLVCTSCWLVQTEDYAGREAIFTDDYVYFSSISTSWVDHARRYVDAMVARFGLDARALVVEVAANDGYLLQFVQQRGIPCYGVEPTRSTADAARARGVEIVDQFFGRALATRLAGDGRAADLIAANNVLAHVPDINDFVAGFTALLKPSGVATFEFPHLLRMVADVQFDTAYHEHFSYLSFTAAHRILARGGLRVFDVEALPTHGGSLRVYAQRADAGARAEAPAVAALLEGERASGVETVGFYDGFQRKAEGVKDDLLRFLLDARREGRRLAGYGAAAKGNTLLNFAGVKPDLLPVVYDAAPSKQGRFLPGSRIPVRAAHRLAEERPDDLLILPWNIADEVVDQLRELRSAGTRMWTAVPRMTAW